MLLLGTVLQSRYRILSLLGQGGMGAVYKAWDLRLNVPVAVKEMVPQPGLDPQTLARLRQQFQQEATVLARLSHPNLVRVSDFFEEDDNAYLVMEFVEGKSLAELINEQGRLPETQVLGWADQLLDALAYCHGQGIIHRDIKPQNIIIRADGRPVLVDFGLVKLWNPQDPRTQTVIRAMGTPEYAPPEQYGVSGHTDPRSDLYSLGATLYHALTGQPPLSAIERMARPGQFRPLRALAPRVRAATEAAVMRAMELAADMRFASAAEMRAALLGSAPFYTVAPVRPAAQAMPEAIPASVPPTRPFPWVWAGVGAGLFLLALLFCGVMLTLRLFAISPEPTATPAVSPTHVVTTPTATAVPPSPTPLPQPCPLQLDQRVQVSENARIWPQPDVLNTNFITSLVPGTFVYIAEGPRWGRIRKDMDSWGWWWYVREGPNADGLGWIWEGRIVKCGAPPPPPTATPACPAVGGPFAALWRQYQDRLGCAVNNAHTSWIAQEHFDRGQMFWREDNDRIAVLYNTGSWALYRDIWVDGDPEYSCPEIAPSQSPPTPRRGFGKIWCTYAEVRQGLGWATDYERGFYGTVQDFERGTILRTDNNELYIIFGDGVWVRP